MNRAYGREGRLKAALMFRGIDPKKINLGELTNVLIKKGITEAKMCNVYGVFIHFLEPGNCEMYHCSSHGANGFCNCCDGFVPNKCKKYRDFKNRCKARALEAIEKIFTGLGKLKGKINYDMEAYSFFDQLAKLKGFEFVGKWSWRLRDDAWREMQNMEKKREKEDAQNIL